MNKDLASARWRKSSYSGGSGGNCVEVARMGDVVVIWHSQEPGGPVVAFTRGEWEAFLGGVAKDEFGWDRLPQREQAGQASGGSR